MQKILLEQHLLIDYVAAVDANTLRPVDTVDRETALLIAARVGTTRLIDNMIVKPD
jgi:pantothenate synthetase